MKKKKKTDTITSFLVKWAILPCIGLIVFLFLLAYYPVIALIILLAVLSWVIIKVYSHCNKKRLYIESIQRQQTIGSLIAEFHQKPHDFEHYVADLFSFYGYNTTVTSGSNDGGKDIVMTKDGQQYVVEVKLYATYNKISREKIQKLHSAMWDCHADRAFFVTTSCYTSTAMEFAARNNIKLIDGDELIKMIDERRNTYLGTSP